jgi:hypothetical protein
MQPTDAELLDNKASSADGVAPTRELYIFRRDAQRIASLAGIEFKALSNGAEHGPEDGYVGVVAHVLKKTCRDAQEKLAAAKAEAEAKAKAEAEKTE